MRLTTRTDQICMCRATNCHQPATFWDEETSGFYCEPCMVAISHEPPDRKLCERSSCQRPSVVTHFYNAGGQERLCVEHAALPVKEAVQAEVGAADAAVSNLETPPQGTAGGDYSAWANWVPAPHVQVPIAYGSGWASGYSAGWKAGMAYAIARQAEGTL